MAAIPVATGCTARTHHGSRLRMGISTESRSRSLFPGVINGRLWNTVPSPDLKPNCSVEPVALAATAGIKLVPANVA